MPGIIEVRAEAKALPVKGASALENLCPFADVNLHSAWQQHITLAMVLSTECVSCCRS